MKSSFKLTMSVFLLINILATTGCSVFMAAKQPERKDTKILVVGVPRATVLSELGAPISTVKKGNETIDIFSFKLLLNKVMVKHLSLVELYSMVLLMLPL